MPPCTRTQDRIGACALAITCLAVSISGVACGDAALDEVRWSCVSDRECGAGQRCELGLCVPVDARGVVRGLVCQLPANETREHGARFSIDGVGVQRELIFATGVREVRFALPAEVVSLDAGPLEQCCENPCCALTSP